MPASVTQPLVAGKLQDLRLSSVYANNCRMKRLSLWAVALLVVAGTALAQNSKIIKIVSSLPRTGSANGQTSSMVNGLKMAIAEAGGKVGDYRIAYEDWDDASPERGQWDPALEAANAHRAVADNDIMAYIGTYNSGAAKISVPILNQAALAMISPANTYPGLTKPGLGEANEPAVYRPSGKINYFRVVPADDIQGEVAAQFVKSLGVKKVYVIHDRELYGKGVADVFKRVCGKLGIEVVGYDGIDPKAANYRSLVTKIKSSGAELVYFGGTTQTNAGQLVKDLVAGGCHAKFMSPDGTREQAFIEAAGKGVLDGRAYVTFGGLPPSELKGKGREFYENYKKQYGTEPEAYAVYGYECGRVALDGIRRAGKKDRSAITDAIAGIKDFEGALGQWSFDANGDTTLKVMVVETVKDGKFSPVKIVGLPTDTSPSLPVYLVVWNHVDKPIAIIVSIDGKVAFDSVAGVRSGSPKIVIREQIKLSPGNHSVFIQDKTRNIRKQIDLPLRDTANINLFLDPDDTKLSYDFEKNPGYQ